MSKTRNQRRRSKEQIMLWLAVLAWAVTIVAVLFVELPKRSAEGNDTAPTESAPEATKMAVIEAVIEEPEEQVEPEEPVSPPLLLDKLPMIENATLTHYCICKKCCGKEPDHPAYGITASGRPAEPYVSVAVDPIMIELGSKVYVDYGDGEIHEYRADDTGSAIAGAKIDLCVSDHQEALELGVKTVKVWYER